ncbi:benzoate/H(+) symporter BenE family transporter [Dactylosporangium matsuzakiense]|uniref:Benzoate transporter n=1 Tax=Dactylosporangium matsuzakiense TaxID=53360 RepID=A0A9W6KQS4_9ACTN|nr:benzoate/H(+) symporter BenE family transporter [Dactylosporangium matsuzakiense]UWZ41806.1 benzoate/H(+) symporter BenE family transporter [Dactylosporangium matsuzakiense]GLL05542.1 benzoate transporter [Dactylosporangium matsuzakiense]
MRRDLLPTVLAGLVSALVGYASSFTVVLAGLRAVGATPAQAASGLLAVCLAIGATAVWLSVRYRMPIAIAWSTPGAALLVATGPVPGGFPAAVGAFLVSAALMVLAGLLPWLTRLIAAIPRPIAGAMLAGVILSLCTAPVRAMVDLPLLATPVVVAWALLFRLARQWAVPGALVAAVAAIAVHGPGGTLSGASLRPSPVLMAPTLNLSVVVSLAIPLFLVTMAAQNVPGMAVMATYGYTPPLRPILIATGLTSAAAAPFGGHAVNLAAITAALTAGPDTHPDPRRRWVATVALGAGQLTLGLGASLAMALVLLSPPILVVAVAGLALLPALGSSLASAVTEPQGREAAVVTFVVTASGTTILGVGSAFWGLLAGILIALLLHRRPEPGIAPAEAPLAPAEATAEAPAPR